MQRQRQKQRQRKKSIRRLRVVGPNPARIGVVRPTRSYYAFPILPYHRTSLPTAFVIETEDTLLASNSPRFIAIERRLSLHGEESSMPGYRTV